MSRCLRWPAAIFAGLLLTAPPVRAAESTASPVVDDQTAAFLRQHCVRCHGEKQAEHDVRLDLLDANYDRPATFAQWHAVLAQLQKGTMPPEDEPRPDAAQSATVARRIAARLDEVMLRRRAEGRTVLRRLNRTEYENTVRDMFDVDVRVKEYLPEDAIALGFDNIGAALNVSPVLMERYLEAADAVYSAATAPVPVAESQTQRFELYDSLPSYYVRTVYKRDDGTVLFSSERSTTQLSKFRAPVPGIYRFRIFAAAYQSKVPMALAVLVGNFNTAAGSARHIGYVDVLPGEKRVIEIEARLVAKNETIKVAPARLPVAYLRQEVMPEYEGSGILVDWIEVEGPLPAKNPSAGYRRVYGDVDPKQGTLADAEQRLRELLPRAFRRPTTDDDLKPYSALMARMLDAGQTFDDALRSGIKAILSSPQFLYFREPAGPLDDHALATRLSYFLWSTTPDQTLFDLAARGELRQPEVLRSQVERMLKDPRSQNFVENFCGQWLSLRDIELNTPDEKLYPEFDRYLEWSMVQETEHFFTELLQNDLSVMNFIDSDFAMINDRLAEHYGIPGVVGSAIRRVSLKPEYRRGGVLTQASVLKVTANGTTTSPVVRGVWVLDRILGEAAAPPPPNVPAVEPDIRGATTIREQLAKHREIESCGACHRKIDPPGFALENYDVIGGYRENYRALGVKARNVANPNPKIDKYLKKDSYGEGKPVDAGDVLPDGRKFANAEEFKQLLLADPDAFARTMTKKLLTYATGNGVEYGDDSTVEKIVDEVRAKGYGLRSLVQAVVQSELFRSK